MPDWPVHKNGRRGGAAPGAPAPATPPAAQPARPDWEATHLADLDNASLKKGAKLTWLGAGGDDNPITNTSHSAKGCSFHKENRSADGSFQNT